MAAKLSCLAVAHRGRRVSDIDQLRLNGARRAEHPASPDELVERLDSQLCEVVVHVAGRPTQRGRNVGDAEWYEAIRDDECCKFKQPGRYATREVARNSTGDVNGACLEYAGDG